MKPNQMLNRFLALCLCVLCLCVFLLPAAAAKKGTTSFRHSSVKVKLAYTHTVYSGKAKTPAVTVKHDGKQLREGEHYTLHYRDNVEVGDATVIIRSVSGSGYTGKRVYTFSIVPKKVEQPTLVKATETSLKFRWAPVTGATGYVVYYYNAIKNTYKKIKATHKTAMTVDGLQPDTTYLFCVRAYTLTDTNRLYGKYSAWLNAKTKADAGSSLLSPYRRLLKNGTFTLTFTKDDDAFAGTPVTVCSQSGNLSVQTKLAGSNIKLIRRADGAYLLLPRLKRYTAISDSMLRDTLDAADYDDLVEDLLQTTAGAPQKYTVRSGKKLLQRELYTDTDGDTIACDFDGETLVRLVYTDAQGEVNVTTISAFSGDVPADAFEIPDSYTLSQTLSL